MPLDLNLKYRIIHYSGEFSWILHVADPFIIPKNQFLKRPTGIWDLVFKYPMEQNP